MAIVKEVYSSTRVNLIYQLLKNEADGGNPKEYDIRVDDLKVVSRTSDPERFHGHEEFVLPETKNIVINIYDGTSNRCTRYNLLLREEEPSREELSGIEKSLNAKMLQERRKWEYDQLKKDYEQLREQLKESEEFAEKLKSELGVVAAENHKLKSSHSITDLVVNVAGVLLAKNPKALNGIPLIGGLLGGGNSSEPDASTTTETTVEETTAACESKQELQQRTYTGEVKEKDIEDLKLALIPFFQESNLENVEEIISYLHYRPGYVTHVLNGLKKAMQPKEQSDSKQTEQQTKQQTKQAA